MAYPNKYHPIYIKYYLMILPLLQNPRLYNNVHLKKKKKMKLLNRGKCWDQDRNYSALLDIGHATVGYFCSASAQV